MRHVIARGRSDLWESHSVSFAFLIRYFKFPRQSCPPSRSQDRGRPVWNPRRLPNRRANIISTPRSDYLVEQTRGRFAPSRRITPAGVLYSPDHARALGAWNASLGFESYFDACGRRPTCIPWRISSYLKDGHCLLYGRNQLSKVVDTRSEMKIKVYTLLNNFPYASPPAIASSVISCLCLYHWRRMNDLG